MSGTDSLYSIVQMPPGVPVATMAINGAKNAGIMAASILGTSNQGIADKVIAFKKEMEEVVLQKAKNLEEKGHKNY